MSGLLVLDSKPPKRGCLWSTRSQAGECHPSATAPGTKPPPVDDDAGAHEFRCEILELWSLDEHACRQMPSCNKHVPIRDSAASQPPMRSRSPMPAASPRNSGYSVNAYLSPKFNAI